MIRSIYFLLYFTCVRLASASNYSETNSAEQTFDFVNKVRSKLLVSPNPKIILLIGNTGVGKSTLVHYVTGNYSRIMALEPEGSSSEYRVHDGLDEGGDMESSTVSRTLIPEMNVDEEQNVWYDCPGFGDTRNETVEIATTFLIKSVIENAKSIKIVLVVNYDSVTATHDRQDFDRSLTRVVELAQNITKFEDSISLVITKAPSYYIRGREISEMSEESVKNSTAQFAIDLREVLKQKGSNEKKIKLIDTFLKQTLDGDYSRISVFWRPMEAGPFDKIIKMVNGRRSIRESITQHTSYTSFEANDFGFPLTAEARLKITDIADQTISQMARILENIDDRLLRAMQQQIQSSEDIHTKLESLEIWKKNLRSFNVNEEVESLAQRTDQFKSLIRAFNINSIDMEDFSRIERHESNFNILKSLVGTEISLPINDLMKISSKSSKYQAIEHEWYSFLVQVFDFFSTFEVQKDVTAYDVAGLADWGQINKIQGLTVDIKNFAEFTKLFPGVSIPDSNATPTKLKELNEIINVMLRAPVQYECNSETLVIKGNFVRSANIQTSKCPQILKKINVFVVNTFFADEDLNLRGIEELKVYTPIWRVQRAVSFNLNGIHGAAHEPQPNRGTAGKPGNAGKNAGHFFAFADEVVNGQLLTVTLNGGCGGTGQDGTDSEDDTVQFQYMSQEDDNEGLWHSISPREDIRISIMLAQYNYEAINGGYRLYSRCCGNTGSGGRGGLGGYPGSYLFLIANNATEHLPKVIANIGSNGTSGKTGRLCKSTAVDIRKEVTKRRGPAWGFYRYRTIILSFSSYVNDPKCPDKLVWSEVPVPQPNPRTELDVTRGIIEYKNFLIENMKDSAFRSLIRKVYDAIEVSQRQNHT